MHSPENKELPPQCQRSIKVYIYAGIPDSRGEFSALLFPWRKIKIN